MSDSWKLSAFAPKPVIQQALLAHEELDDWDADVVISGREISEDRPNDWVLEAWYPTEPGAAQKLAISQLFDKVAPIFDIEKLAEQDWVTLSQQGVEPIRAGRFYVHTPEHPPERDVVNIEIPASQAFGTGQHETTAGCLEMLHVMERRGVVSRNIADIGTGTGLLALAAMHLWPRALFTASDIDAVCVDVVADNVERNDFKLGADRGQLTMVVADGMEDELLQARGPYDLLIANILAGPLVDLARDFAGSVAPGGNILLAGLLETQEPAVRKAYRLAGFRLAERRVNGDWSILWMRKRRI